MSTPAKIHLSELETELVENKNWILTKHLVINKVFHFFGELNDIYKKIIKHEQSFLPELKNSNGKISKGENYEGLPYVMLDYPALFSKENVFAIRTMFWWGNFFSITLHLSGEKHKLREGLFKNLSYLARNNFFVCVSENQWQHTFDVSNYISANQMNQDTFKEVCNRNFFKISKSLELNQWNEAPAFLERSFREIIDFIKINFPADGKVLSPGFPIAGSDL